ncbi:sigma factor [Nonomuraea aurantiaca]|uniref:sigma factor n=1 Tax=Nonomuraea aurantiaca TaxID=2878562 RepID=UPI001CDA3141|nr:sigma factor [Nonomuraea aurantiaca]MCA2229582.1 hypothetical protein [Nonomuraea aurantiaca]
MQETYLRAWRAFERFEGRSSVRSWLYRIATNACLTALDHASRRVLPSGLMNPCDNPYAPPPSADPRCPMDPADSRRARRTGVAESG